MITNDIKMKLAKFIPEIKIIPNQFPRNMDELYDYFSRNREKITMDYFSMNPDVSWAGNNDLEVYIQGFINNEIFRSTKYSSLYIYVNTIQNNRNRPCVLTISLQRQNDNDIILKMNGGLLYMSSGLVGNINF